MNAKVTSLKAAATGVVTDLATKKIRLTAENQPNFIKLVSSGLKFKASAKKVHKDRKDVTANTAYDVVVFEARGIFPGMDGSTRLGIRDATDDETAIYGADRKETWDLIVPKDFDVDAAVMDLRLALVKRALETHAAFNTPHVFKHGQVVEGKAGLWAGDPENVYIFQRMLTTEDLAASAIIDKLSVGDDCMLLVINSDTAIHARNLITDSRRIQPVTIVPVKKSRKRTSAAKAQ